MYRIRATYLPRPDLVFDLAYYFRVHVPLAQKTTAGKLKIRRMEVESRAESLLEPGSGGAPCVLCIDLETLDDVAAFRRLLQSDAVQALREDVPRYTNCALEWTVSEVRGV
jgi:uncharacterized protein (TIGR02118 family)